MAQKISPFKGHVKHKTTALVYFFIDFLVAEIPSILSIIGIPSILGSIGESRLVGNVIAFVSGAILTIYLSFRSESILDSKLPEIWRRTGFEEKHIEKVWNLMLLTSGVIGALVISLLVQANVK